VTCEPVLVWSQGAWSDTDDGDSARSGMCHIVTHSYQRHSRVSTVQLLKHNSCATSPPCPDSAFNRRRPLCIYEPAAPAWPLMTINPLMMSRAREDTAADTTHRAPAVAMTTHLSAFSNRTFLLHDNDDVYTSRGHYRTTAQHNTVCHHT